MESPRMHVVTLGVSDIAKSRHFYEALGWKASSTSNEHFVVFHSQGALLALFAEKALASDAAVESTRSGFRGIACAMNVRHKDDVAKELQRAKEAGATITKAAVDVFWGGHSGYFADPDGHLWEVAWNPHWPLQDDGSLTLPQ